MYVGFQNIPVVDAALYADKQYVISRETESENKLVPIYNTSTGGSIRLNHPESIVYEVSDVIVHPESDIVALYRNGAVKNCILEKSKYPMILKSIPHDVNIMGNRQHTFSRGGIRNLHLDFYLSGEVKKAGKVINLLTANDWHWGHALVELIPAVKWCIDNKIEGDLLISSRTDKNIIEILEFLLQREQGNRKIIQVEAGQSMLCSQAVLIPHGVYISNHAVVMNNCDIVIRNWAVDILEQLSCQLREHFASPNYDYAKVFVSRTGTRVPPNHQEVTDLFKTYGFVVLDDLTKIYGDRLDLSLKMKIYGGITHLAGFIGSAFFNSLFMNPKSKVLGLGSCVRSLDRGLTPIRHVDMLYFQCPEESPNVHANYHVPMDELDECLKFFVSQDPMMAR